MVHCTPPRKTSPWRSRNLTPVPGPVRSMTSRSGAARSRIASSASVGMCTAVSSPSPVELGEATGVALVGLDPGAGGHRDQRRGDHLAGHPETLQQAGQLVAGRSRPRSKGRDRGSPSPEIQALARGLVGEEAVDHRHLGPGASTAEVIESLWTSRPTNVGSINDDGTRSAPSVCGTAHNGDPHGINLC